MTIELFETAKQRLQMARATADRPPSHNIDAACHLRDEEQLLLRLGYLGHDPETGLLRATAEDSTVTANRLALLALAAKLERFFPLPCRQAPGVMLLGGEVAPARFGLKAPDQAVVGVGGRGLTWLGAFEGCIGEAAEYLSFLVWGNEQVEVASARSIGAVSAERLGCETAWMYRNLGLDPEDLDLEIGWMTARSLDGSKLLPVPADLCIRRVKTPEAPTLRKAESSGCPAAPTLEDAQFRGLMELIERDAVALWWYGGCPAKPLTLDASDGQALDEMMSNLRTSESRHHWFLDITSGIGIPAVAALSCDQDGAGVISGFAADLDPLVAARSAALELCQMEMALDLVHLKIEQGGQEALSEIDRQHLERKRRLRMDAYPCLSPGPAHDSTPRQAVALSGSELYSAVATLAKSDLKAYWVDLTRQDIGIPVARALVPGLQSADPQRLSKRLTNEMKHNGKMRVRLQDLPPII